MKKNIIQIREEEKVFLKKDVSEVLGISSNTLNRWIKKGRIQMPSGKNKKFSTKNVEKIFLGLNIKSSIILSAEKYAEWCEIRKSKMCIKKGGVFLLSNLVKRKEINFNNMIDKLGLWRAQGLNNHEHMINYVKNGVLQYYLAKELLNIWIKKVRAIKPKSDVVIYFNEKTNSTVCIYLMSKIDNNYLRNYDRYLKIDKCKISELSI